MTIIYTGQEAPLDGMRRLTAREASQRAKAIACVRSQSIQCQGQVYVGVFLDGTGNNDGWIEPGHDKTQRARNKHSNVARLYDAHVGDPSNGIDRHAFFSEQIERARAHDIEANSDIEVYCGLAIQFGERFDQNPAMRPVFEQKTKGTTLPEALAMLASVDWASMKGSP